MRQSTQPAHKRMWDSMLESPSSSSRRRMRTGSSSHGKEEMGNTLPAEALVVEISSEDEPVEMENNLPIVIAAVQPDAATSGSCTAEEARSTLPTFMAATDEEMKNTLPNVIAAVPTAAAFVQQLLATALREWRGVEPTVVPPFSIFDMEGREVISPRGIAFHPSLVAGSFAASIDAVGAKLQATLDTRRDGALFYIGSTVDLLRRWRDLRDERGNRRGHAFYPPGLRWHCMLVLYQTDTGDDCANMEEALIEKFARGAYARGCCQNKSDKALGVDRASRVPHWVYCCLTTM